MNPKLSDNLSHLDLLRQHGFNLSKFGDDLLESVVSSYLLPLMQLLALLLDRIQGSCRRMLVRPAHDGLLQSVYRQFGTVGILLW